MSASKNEITHYKNAVAPERKPLGEEKFVPNIVTLNYGSNHYKLASIFKSLINEHIGNYL